MSKKLLYFDTETTGTNPYLNDIIQLAGMVVINGEVKETFNWTCQPHSWENISQEALDVHGMQIEDLQGFEPPQMMYDKFIAMMSKYVNKYDKNDKFYPAGYNVRFDLDSVGQFMKKCGDKYGFGTWQNWRAIDPFAMMPTLDYLGLIKLPDYKLSTVCEHYGIEINAHDALSDIVATREVLGKIYQIFPKKS